MRAISGKDFARLLEERGWELRRTKGSHRVYTKQGHPARILLPVHGNSLLKIGLLRHFMKIAGIAETEL